MAKTPVYATKTDLNNHKKEVKKMIKEAIAKLKPKKKVKSVKVNMYK